MLMTVSCELYFDVFVKAWPFFQMEQSRHVYEDASKQLGYFFELFSDHLPLSPYGPESGRNDAVGWRSRTLMSEEEGISSLSMSNLQARRKSTSCTSTATRRHPNAHKSRSTSMNCASDTSCCDYKIITKIQGEETRKRAIIFWIDQEHRITDIQETGRTSRML